MLDKLFTFFLFRMWGKSHDLPLSTDQRCLSASNSPRCFGVSKVMEVKMKLMVMVMVIFWCISINRSVYLSICLSVYLSIYLYIYNHSYTYGDSILSLLSWCSISCSSPWFTPIDDISLPEKIGQVRSPWTKPFTGSNVSKCGITWQIRS